jgi:hypothetical protein
MKRHTVTTYSDEFDGFPYEVQFEPAGDVMAQRVGDRLVVAYNVQDEDCENPMTSCDCEGKLYTKPYHGYGGGSITDDSSWGHHLGLDEYGEIDLDADGIEVAAMAKLPGLIPNAVWVRWMMELDTPLSQVRYEMFQTWSGDYVNVEWSEEDQEIIEALPTYDSVREECWGELNEQGKIGSYLAVPVRYCSSVHGPGTAQAYVTNLDSADAVWVPDACAIENIKSQCWPAGVQIYWTGGAGSKTDPLFAKVKVGETVVAGFDTWAEAQEFVSANYGEGTYQDLYTAAKHYAKGVLDEYVKWCNGECYGCVVQTYKLEDDVWVEKGDWDSCWGYIGYEYAEETLKDEYFLPAVKDAEEKNAVEAAQEAEDIRTQRGLQTEMEV